MVMKRVFYILTLLALISSCTEDEWMEPTLTPEQQELIGSAVNFNMSMADPFETRTTYNVNGSFNQSDLMMIYRQYEVNGKFDSQTEVFRAYEFKYQNAPGTDVVLKRDWKIIDSAESGKIERLKGDYSASGASRILTTDRQLEQDSLTWENGETVRFRAWSRSNLANAITNSSNKNYYYPDFCIADWVTVSGPTRDIPMTLKHLGCRITFVYKNSGNRIAKVDIATDPEDYAREDNASDLDSDLSDKFPKTIDGREMSAEEAAANVLAAYNKMSLPAGVDIETGLLRAMTKEAYEKTTDFRRIEEWEYTEEGRKNYVSFGQLKTSADVASKVQHPVFAQNDVYYYLLTIPYDISEDYGGEPITLPPYTRFKIWLRDVNGGDKDGSMESEYHIFSLSDIMDGTTPAFPEGLALLPGYSYQFKVGYRYNQMSITPGKSFSWDEQDAEVGNAPEEELTATPNTRPYGWWKAAIDQAIDDTKNNQNYWPEFHITNENEFLEFINLVNGEAARAEGQYGKIYRLVEEYESRYNTDKKIYEKVPKKYGWSRTNNQANPSFVPKSTLEAQGYLFYERYVPSDANRKAYSVEDYLNIPYSFHDEKLQRHFTVYLDCDLDFLDQKIQGIGLQSVSMIIDNKTGETKDYNAAFRGYFDGYNATTNTVHTIRNLNVQGYYLFNYVTDAAIRNLKIESTHTVGLVNTAYPTVDVDNQVVGTGCQITGISVKANNKETTGVNAIAHSLTGPSVVVGCIHEGDAAGPLVGMASDLTMYGCMRTADNISGAALLGSYMPTAYGNKGQFFAPKIKFSDQANPNNTISFSQKPEWSSFMCNYYNKDLHELSKDAKAVADIADDYSLQEYIRGRQSTILKAVYDNLLSREVQIETLLPKNSADHKLEGYYGLAPWKAMNYAIYKYNTTTKYKDHPCMMHYEVSETNNGTLIGYDHHYPQLKAGKPSEKWTVDQLKKWDVLKQNN